MLRTFMSLLVAGVLICQPIAIVNADVDCETCEKTIVENAIAAEFNTLVEAVKAGELVEFLSGEGPFTVFAPTDEAFKKLPEGTLKNLLKEENKDQLVAILKLHVVEGKVMAKDVVGLEKAETLGGEVTIKVEDDKVMVNGATVTQTDVECSNGVIHIVDSVILPMEKK